MQLLFQIRGGAMQLRSWLSDLCHGEMNGQVELRRHRRSRVCLYVKARQRFARVSIVLSCVLWQESISHFSSSTSSLGTCYRSLLRDDDPPRVEFDGHLQLALPELEQAHRFMVLR